MQSLYCRVSPTPLLMIVGRNDSMTPTDMALAACERALEPKRLAPIPGGHFSPCPEEFEAVGGGVQPVLHASFLTVRQRTPDLS
ncbi:hypothetical protein GCM10010254_24030 [Streptomyces chromofuscus]|nr:hypothetical protein GCM10010254_24030 [Streptomyces chromofuscus]